MTPTLIPFVNNSAISFDEESCYPNYNYQGGKMKTVKMSYPMALLLVTAILVPLTTFGGPRDATISGPVDDQPWGGEINNTDYMTQSINSVGVEPFPIQPVISTIRNFGSPLILFDYVKFFIFDNKAKTENSSISTQINISSVPESKSIAPSPIRTKRFSIRKGR